jgi:hypothetical protein
MASARRFRPAAALLLLAAPPPLLPPPPDTSSSSVSSPIAEAADAAGASTFCFLFELIPRGGAQHAAPPSAKVALMP